MIPTRPGLRKTRFHDPDDWLPYDAFPTVETASFWAMVDHGHRKDSDDGQEQEEHRRSDTCTEAKTAPEDDDNNQSDAPGEYRDHPAESITVECFVPDGGSGALPYLTIATHRTEVETAGDTMATETSATIALEKIESNSIGDTPEDVSRSRDAIDTRPVSTIILVCFLLLSYLYLRFGEKRLSVDLICGFVIFIFLLFYRVEGILRQ